MKDSCHNCKWLKFLGEDRLNPFRCRKDPPGVTHDREWLSAQFHTFYECENWERRESDEQ